MTWPVGAAVVIGLSGAVWATSLALEWALKRWHERTAVSEGTLRDYARTEMAQGWDWPSQPRWHDPKTVARMRRQEQRQMKLVDKQRRQA